MTDRVTAKGFSKDFHEHYHDSTGFLFDGITPRVKTWFNYFHGIELPTWRTLVKRQINATTAATWARRDYEEDLYQSYHYDLLYWTGTEWAVFRGVDRYNSGPILNRPVLSTDGLIDGGAADIAARTKFLQNVRQLQTSFQGGTFLGELRETLEMIRHPAQALRHGIDTYVRAARKAIRRNKSPRAIRKALSGTWLEFQYGWKPLINDIADLSKAAGEQSAKESTFVVSGNGSSETSSEEHGVGGGSSIAYEYAVLTKYKTSVRYVAKVRMFNDQPIPVLARFGLNWSNFVPTVWELIPYSFLVDYFSNIGNLIDSACVGNFIIAWGYGNYRQEGSEQLLFFRQPPVADTIDFKYKNLGDHVRSFANSCALGGRFNVSSVSVGVGDLRLKLPIATSPRWLNIAALASQRRG